MDGQFTPGTAPAHGARAQRTGITLLELLIALAVLAILAAMAVPRVTDRRDRIAVRHAARLIADALATARSEAMAISQPVAVQLDAPHATLTVHAESDTLARLMLGGSHGVSLRATRDSMAYTPGGLGLGAANLTIAVTRGSAAETVTVSRLGRVRW